MSELIATKAVGSKVYVGSPLAPYNDRGLIVDKLEIDQRNVRLRRCNLLLWGIADHGRTFFRTGETVAKLEMDSRHRIWFHDDYSKKRIYTHRPYLERGFTHGGTLNELIRAMRDYIVTGIDGVGRRLGPWPAHYCGGDLWGYGDDMQIIRDEWAMGDPAPRSPDPTR